MPEEVKQDATPESSSALAEAIASSPEALADVKLQISDTQTSPAQEEVNQEQSDQRTEEGRVPFNEHPRFKELIEERNWYRQQLEQRFQQQLQPQLQQPTQNLYAGMTPEQEQQARWLDERIDQRAEQKIAKLNPLIDATRMELARIGVILFRKDYPDVKPNSPEESAIAQRISMGLPTDEAYKVVMYDKKVAKTEEQENNRLKQRTEAKKSANVEQHSIPQGATSPTKEKLTLRQQIDKTAKEVGF